MNGHITVLNCRIILTKQYNDLTKGLNSWVKILIFPVFSQKQEKEGRSI